MSKQYKKVNKAFYALEAAAREFQNEISKFKKVYDTEDFGLKEWIQSIDEALYDIDAELSYEFADEDSLI